ncbi:MAG TPA: GntR family transcriptional regulator [Jatrophihabitans sp.]|nr:GntR family transcriptional regulator [Jatrophihabitans sp.]
MSAQRRRRDPPPEPDGKPDADAVTQAVLRSLRIDRSSPIPLWYQTAQCLQSLIENGTVPPGSQLDNELLLSRRLNLSRPTVRRAMEHLVGQGLIVRRRGIGTRVIQQKVRRPLALTSLYDDLRTSGKEPTTVVLVHRVVLADAEVAAALEIDEGAEVVMIERVRRAGRQPIAHMTNYLRPEQADFTTEDLERGGLYEALRSHGVVLHAATQTIGAKRATAAEARALDEERGAALLTMQRTAYDDHGRPVEFGRHVYAASRYSFHTQLLSP